MPVGKAPWPGTPLFGRAQPYAASLWEKCLTPQSEWPVPLRFTRHSGTIAGICHNLSRTGWQVPRNASAQPRLRGERHQKPTGILHLRRVSLFHTTVARAANRGARVFLLLLLPAFAAACTTTGSGPGTSANAPWPMLSYYQDMYGEIEDNGIVIPAVDVTKIDRQYLRQMVDYPTSEPVGTIVIDPGNRFLYLVMENGKAMRYGIGVAKAGLEYEGDGVIGRKAEWPNWAPTLAMIEREPERYRPLAAGMLGGLTNPLGSRALYLYKDGKDTLYRIHGTTEPWSIGKSVSSGCIRLLNHDIMDLYKRVPRGARMVVLGAGQPQPGTV
ncbi:L,D-transpeptidase [Nitratireductor aquimarinus]|nr:L,D-transpeptidase [Nitratireductor aquimarinus]MBN7763589.1 L,D-transpeptidase [Nitratireductor aquibiodomus]MBY6023688.1 L,D-transpeptidase [Nitratireductor sp. DP7N14-4]